MDYKKIIKSRKTRQKILSTLQFVPDKLMIKLQYRIKTGRKLNLKNPSRFTEKLQWYKLYYRDPLMQRCVDKYNVRNYVSECGLEDILIHYYGVYNAPDEIEWGILPPKFVIKDTLGGGGNDVIVCEKTNINLEELNQRLTEWVKINPNAKNGGREWVYDGQKHRIYIEDFLESSTEEGGLVDYKFFCFNGKCEFLYVLADRKLGNEAGLGIFDRGYHRLPIRRCDENILERNIIKPDDFDKMIEIAESLAYPFPEVRVDLYYQNQHIYFGEMTFFDGSGYMRFEPDEFDFLIGEKFSLPPKNNKSFCKR